MPRDDADRHWSKDYVEHLRAVHFTLIALSLTLIVLATSSSRTEIVIAHREIEDLLEMIRTWNTDWLEAEARVQVSERIGQKGDPAADRFRTDPPDANAIEITQGSRPARILPVRFVSPNWIVWGKIRERRDSPRSRRVSLKPPSSLAEFRELWDSLSVKHTILLPRRTEPTLFIQTWSKDYNVDTRVAKYRYVRTGSSTNAVELEPFCNPSADLLGVMSQRSMKGAYACGFFGAPSNQESLELPFEDYREFDFDAQAGLAKPFMGRWRHGDFSYSFRELDTVTKDFQQLDFATLERIIAAEEARRGESFEALGIKFPAEGTTRWGILIVLAVQIYFWIHIRELASELGPDDSGWDVAWIGVYSSTAARIVFVISAFIFPLCAVLTLGIRGLYVGSFTLQYFALCIAGAVASLVVSVLSWKRAPRGRGRRPATV